MATKLNIMAASAAPDDKQINQEWIELTNEGDAPFNAEGCKITTAFGAGRQRDVTNLQPGLIVKPGERVRLITGSTGKSSHGEPPAEGDGVRNVHLFLKGAYLERAGIVVRIVNKQHQELCRYTLGAQAAG